MSVLLDLWCRACETVHGEDVAVSNGEMGVCPGCGAALRQYFGNGKVAATDVKGCEQRSLVLEEPGHPGEDCTYTTGRELDRKMKMHGFEPCGDKVGGARNEDHQILGKTFSLGVRTDHKGSSAASGGK